LQNDPAAQPWRGLIAAQDRRLGRMPAAISTPAKKPSSSFEPVWRARISAWQALTALRTNDIGSGRRLASKRRSPTLRTLKHAVAAFAAAGWPRRAAISMPRLADMRRSAPSLDADPGPRPA
jgi:hypothetical protein